MKSRSHLILLAFGISAIPVACTPAPRVAWSLDDPRLYASAPVEPVPAIAAEAWAVRYEAVRLNDRLFIEAGITDGDTIAAPIFNEWTLTAFVERIDVVADHRNIRARLFPPQEGVILLTVGQDRVAG
jgi:hypothetical protein